VGLYKYVTTGHVVTVTTVVVGETTVVVVDTTLLPLIVVALPAYPGFGVSAILSRIGSMI
jgi:hypothetical protein